MVSNMKSVFIVFYAILLASSIHLTNGSYEYFRLVLVWPTTFTTHVHPNYGMTIVNPPNYFTIHGLWPTNFSYPWPQYCSKKRKDRFDASLLTQALEVSLNYYWPSLKPAKKNMQFWIDEWEKHGTCSLQRFNQFEYFRNAIYITYNLNIQSVFKNVGIIPSGTKTYSYINIVDAIKTKTYQEPELMCFKDQNHVLLWEIHVCLNASLTGYISCPINNFNNIILCKKIFIKIPV
ncbi:hypothetical protein HN51_023075 [Arachis hypogaea]